MATYLATDYWQQQPVQSHTAQDASPQTAAQTGVKRKHHKLGRARKDYVTLDAEFTTLDDFKIALEHGINNAANASAQEPQRLSCAYTLSPYLRVPIDHNNVLQDPAITDFLIKQSSIENEATKEVRDLCSIQDPKERKMWQRGAARGLLNAIQDVDGFRYSVNNIWTSKDDGGHRFSYTCLDSLENKDRAANTPKATADAEGNLVLPSGARKPTWDCSGQIAIKFSQNNHHAEIIYKHTSVHPTVAERAPPPRKYVKKAERLELEQERMRTQPVVPPKSSVGQPLVEYEVPAWMNEAPVRKVAAPRGRTAIPKPPPEPATPSSKPDRASRSSKPLSLVALLRQAGAHMEALPADDQPFASETSPYLSMPLPRLEPHLAYSGFVPPAAVPYPPSAAAINSIPPSPFAPPQASYCPIIAKRQKIVEARPQSQAKEPSPDPWFPAR